MFQKKSYAWSFLNIDIMMVSANWYLNYTNRPHRMMSYKYIARTVLWLRKRPPGRFQAQFSRNLLRILKNIRNKSFLEFYLVYISVF